MRIPICPILLLLLFASAPLAGAADLVIAAGAKTEATVVVAADSGRWEKRASEDLVHYIELMTGAKVELAAVAGAGPNLFVGAAALAADPKLQLELNKVAKPDPLIRADAIVVRRDGRSVYLAGTNDDSHYFAVARLLHDWGCRWYLPTEIGECIPSHAELKLGDIDFTYAPPFEIRHYWLSWNGDSTGANEFRRRNFMTETSFAGMGHALAKYTEKLRPEGRSIFNVPLAEDATAKSIAEQLDEEYAKGTTPGISLAIEDGNYVNDSASDIALQAGGGEEHRNRSRAILRRGRQGSRVARAHAFYPEEDSEGSGRGQARLRALSRRARKNRYRGGMLAAEARNRRGRGGSP